LINTGGNFIITAKDPAGPWSDPVWLSGADGIDPSIFFDDDGKVWYCGTHPAPEGEAYPGNYEIYIREIDIPLLEKGKNPLLGENIGIWRGALRNVIWPEGPHIYKKDGSYYLLHAEGGTGLDHAVCVARAKNIQGTWEGKKSNPVLTHRHLGKRAEIINVGHADIVDDKNENWWMVLLASRPFDGVCPLGRETFMVPIYWEDGWPYIGTKSGLVENEISVPCLTDEKADSEWDAENPCDHFTDKLPLHWLTLRMPVNEKDASFSLNARNGALRLFTKAAAMREKKHPSFAGRRIRHKNWAFSAEIEFSPKTKNESAGIILLQSEDFQYRFELCLNPDGGLVRRVIRAAGKEDEIIAEEDFPESEAPRIFAAQCEEMKIAFFYGKDQYSMKLFINGIDARILSTEYAGGFTGALAGVFASGNGKDTENYADVLWAEYRGLE
jgi:alpha-N-arabinofuranosidase